MNKISVLFIFLSFIVLSGCKLTEYSDRPTNEPRAVIIEQAPYYQGESVHEVNSESKANKCIRTGCKNTSCCDREVSENRGLGSKYYKSDPRDECLQLYACGLNDWLKRCEWQKSPEYNQCIERIEEEIAETNRKLFEATDKCNYNESCTVDFQFREDHFQLVLPPHKRISFAGDVMHIYDEFEDGTPNGLDITIHIYKGDEGGFFEEYDEGPKKERGVMGNVPVVKYFSKDIQYFPGWDPVDCTFYTFIYNEKTYSFLGHEGCYENLSKKIIETINFIK